MKKIVFIIYLLLLFGCKENLHFDTVISNINIIPIQNDTLYYKTNLGVVGNKIKAIGFEQFTSDTLIDGQGRYLMPGLSDMHVHFPKKKELTNFFNLNLSAGVLYLRSMRGKDWHPKLRDSIIKNNVIAPKLFLSAPPFYAKDHYANIDSLISSYKEKGFDLIKILSVSSDSSFNQIVGTSHKYNLLTAGHASIDLPKLLQSKYNCIEHLDGYNRFIKNDSLKYVVDLTSKTRAYNCPTIDWYSVGYLQENQQNLHQRPGMEFISTTTLSKWDSLLQKAMQDTSPEERIDYAEFIQNKYKILALLDSKKTNLLISPDASGVFQIPGYSVYEEMKHYKKAGLSNYRILEVATKASAEYFNQIDSFGTVQKNKLANLIILDKNPLENIENINSISAIILNGEYIEINGIKRKIRSL